MATVICVDGLGGHPETTFGSLKAELENKGHKVVIADTSGVKTHEDRVWLATSEYLKHCNEQVFLIGQSAGGSAVRVLAERLDKHAMPLSGVVQLSPAMPLGIFYMTRQLFQVMLGRIRDILFGKVICPTEAEYGKLVAPIEGETSKAISSRQPISGVEARKLAFFPPRFFGYRFPTLHIFGTNDVWINPRAQRKLNKMLAKQSSVTTVEVENVGHLTLASSERELVEQAIVKWINNISS